MDILDAAVVVVGADCRILHANQAADAMLQEATTLRSQDGVLRTVETTLDATLSAVISAAQDDGADGRPPSGASLALASAGQPPTFVHILPLDTSTIRTRLIPQRLAAVIVAGNAEPSDALLDGVARTYCLTAAERRLLSPAIRGLGVEHAASVLGISENTVKSHLKQIYKKTGVTRQAELVALIDRLAPPIQTAIKVEIRN